MAGYTYRIERFVGLDQSRDESLVSPAFSPDAMNMDVSDGVLAVAKGFKKLFPARVPNIGTERIDRICFFKSAQLSIPMVISGGCIYTYDSENEEWTRSYMYSLVLEYPRHYSVLMTRIGTEDVMLIADGANRILKFNGTEFSPFGSSEGCSDICVRYIAMYRGRLFAAGDFENPNRLYYSKLPGDNRTIEDWGYDEASPSVEGGHVEIGATTGDPITAICAMSNQLLIFKKSSIYRLIGDRPGNFTVELVEADSTFVSDTATALRRDMIFFVTSDGLHCFNGVDAATMPDSRLIKGILENADTTETRMAAVGDSLFFTVSVGEEKRLIEYDIVNRSYMQYGGFGVDDVASEDGTLIIGNSTRYLEKWGEGGDFDGVPINAYWRVPLTDMGDKASIKTLRELFLRGTSEGGACLRIDTQAGIHRDSFSALLPETCDEVCEVKLKHEGRTFGLKLSNENGGRFRIVGGLEMNLGVRRRTE